MDYATKSTILGGAAAGAVPRHRVAKDVDNRGHPFSFSESKPLPLLQRICMHNGVTHIVDFCAGSAAMAISTSGMIEYEGLAANEVHRDWLDSTVDCCVVYLAGEDKDYAKRLGVQDASLEKLSTLFSGTMLEARRMLEPVQDEEGSEDSEDED